METKTRLNPSVSLKLPLVVLIALVLLAVCSTFLRAEAHGADLVVRGNNITIIEGVHQMNRSIIIEENGTLILRNAVLNFTSTEDYQFETKLHNPLSGTPRLIIENSTIITNGGHQHEIGLYGNSTATIRGLTTSEDVRINAYGNSTIEMVDSVIRGSSVYGRTHSRLNITNTSMVALSGESNTEIYVKNSEIEVYLLSVISLANATIQGLQPGHVEHWDLHENCSTSYLPGEWRTTIIIQDTEVGGFSFFMSNSPNVTIRDSDLKKITVARDSEVWIHNTTSDFGLTTYHESITHAYDSSFGPINSMHNSTMFLTNCTSTYPYHRHQSLKAEYWYLELTVVDPANTTIPQATVTVTHPNTTIIATHTTDPSGQASLVLQGGTTNATGHYPVGPYSVTTTYLTYTNQTGIEMTGNQERTITLPIPVPELTWTSCLLFILLLISASRKELGTLLPDLR
jgi:uncharacterized protein (DUF1330 family)